MDRLGHWLCGAGGGIGALNLLGAIEANYVWSTRLVGLWLVFPGLLLIVIDHERRKSTNDN